MALADEQEPDNSVFGVSNKRTSDPVNPPPIDRQRIFMGTGGDISAPAKARGKSGAGAVSLTRARPNGFAVRQRTLRKG